MHTAVYIVGAISLFRLWRGDHRALWWSILISLVVLAWANSAVRNAVAQVARDNEMVRLDPSLASARITPGSDVVRFCIKVSIAAFAVAAITSVYGLIRSFG